VTDKEAMDLALKEAKKAKGFVSPNPCVGCVILDKNKKFLSSGFYAHYGAIHAEIMALNKLKNKKLLNQAHLFVTLEPCVHFGQNPPCVESLEKYSWGSITYGIEDPNPQVSGRGIKYLKAKGFLVKKTDFFKLELKRFYEAFALNIKEKRSFFALKTASSLDSVATLNHGESQWITEASSKNISHNLRLSFDAILIGVESFLHDNPRLNIRKEGLEKKNKVVLLDPLGRSLPLLSKSRLLTVRSLKDIYVVSSCREEKLKKSGISFISVPKGEINLKALSYKLYEQKIYSVLVEGGIKTFSYFLKQKASSRLYQIINPSFLGGYRGRYWTENLNVGNLKDKIRLKSLEILKTSPDLFLTGILS